MTPRDAVLEQYKRALGWHSKHAAEGLVGHEALSRTVWEAYRTELTDPAPAPPCLCGLCSDAYIHGRLRQIGEERER